MVMPLDSLDCFLCVFLLSDLGPSWPEVMKCYEIPVQTGAKGIRIFMLGKVAQKSLIFRAFSRGKS